MENRSHLVSHIENGFVPTKQHIAPPISRNSTPNRPIVPGCSPNTTSYVYKKFHPFWDTAERLNSGFSVVTLVIHSCAECHDNCKHFLFWCRGILILQEARETSSESKVFCQTWCAIDWLTILSSVFLKLNEVCSVDQSQRLFGWSRSLSAHEPRI